VLLIKLFGSLTASAPCQRKTSLSIRAGQPPQRVTGRVVQGVGCSREEAARYVTRDAAGCRRHVKAFQAAHAVIRSSAPGCELSVTTTVPLPVSNVVFAYPIKP